MNYNYNYIYNFYQSARKYPEKVAIVEKETQITYSLLAKKAQGIANFLSKKIPLTPYSKVGILGSRSITACLGVIAAGWSGCIYVPISPKLPLDRIKKILAMSDLSALIVDEDGYKLLNKDLLGDCPALILSSHDTDNHMTVNFENLISQSFQEPRFMQGYQAAYLIFTSGTTGAPKGVKISCSSLNSFTKNISELFSLTCEDKTVETCELNFDFSVYNMFAPWSVGATLFIIPREQMMNSVKFVQKNHITVWSSVPSVIFMLQKVKTLTKDSLSSLRLSAFCGEPLTLGLIHDWSFAASNGEIKNLYGPTEATVFCLNQNVEEPHKTNPNSDIYAIGKPFMGNDAMVFDTENEKIISSPHEIGELAIGGQQIALDYHNDKLLTNQKFITVANQRWYLTGDLAFKDNEGIFYCAGRVDNQIKYLGHRIELEEIDSYIRKHSGVNMVATILYTNETTQKLISFIESDSIFSNQDNENTENQEAVNLYIKELIQNLKKDLPYYMIPTEIKLMKVLSLTQNGKIDRKILSQCVGEFK